MSSVDINVTVKLESLDKLRLFLDTGLRSEISRFADSVLKSNQENHLGERDPDGTFWPPSRAGTARKAVGGPGTLFDTGRLFRSTRKIATKSGFRLVNDVPYASEHQYGVGQVRRQFLGIPDSFLEGFINTLSERMT